MIMQLSSEQVWAEVEKELFAVLGMVSANNEARTAGIVYIVRNHRLYIVTDANSWKARHIAANPHVSMTVPIAKRVPFMPWIKIPAATITFSGTARLLPPAETPTEIMQALFRGLAVDDEKLAGSCLIEVTPAKEFVTYGVGIPLMQMRYPEKARGRAPVGDVMEEAVRPDRLTDQATARHTE